MNINRVTLVGFAGKDAKMSGTPGGTIIAKLSLATSKRHKDGQDKTQWHTCVAFGRTADYVAKIQTGDHVLLEGELTYREYERTIETESGPVRVEWPITEVVIESISVLERKSSKEKRGAA